jgi:hypothetical protein
VWRVIDGVIDCFDLTASGKAPIAFGADGIIRSRALPGLWIDTRALLDRRLGDALATCAAGIASEEHTAFVSRLAEAASRAQEA